MTFVFIPPRPSSLPLPVNIEEVRRRLREELLSEQRFADADAVLLRVHFDATGDPLHVRALPPRMLGIIPRLMPPQYDARGKRRRRLRWASDPLTLEAAERAGAALRAYPARSGDWARTATVRVVIPMHREEE